EAMSTLPPVIEFRNVTKTFNPGAPGQFTALKDVSFRVDDIPDYGEFIAIVGPSGCGKSTILNLIHGFSDVYPPTGGEVLVRGHRVVGPGRDRGMIFQRYSSFPHHTVLETVPFGLELDEGARLPRAEREARAREWIRKVGLAGHERKYPHQLSGGQQQRVAIARSLVLKPQIILMDEPFSALDEPTRFDMQKLIMDLWHEVEATVMIVSHSIAEAVYLGDRVWIMAAGPGRIAREFTDVIPKTRDADPLQVQETAAFKAAVAEVGEAFRKVDRPK
ncbi:MAG TPA: ABC transporter ATP-binding protein, partial [Vicinamibacteria bacterium]|nr:ABC transporter ATP-binding protein [Vicinamibacteria bacterium]